MINTISIIENLTLVSTYFGPETILLTIGISTTCRRYQVSFATEEFGLDMGKSFV